MKTAIKLIPYLLVGLFLGVFGLLLGRYVFPDNGGPQEQVTSQAILKEVSAQGFLVTHTIISDQGVVHKVDQGSDWSNFWWGHEVEAKATMQTSYGVDLSLLSEDSIEVDSDNMTVCVHYPTPKVYATTLVSDIEVEQKSGVLKKILATDDNEDYNLALDLLTEKANESAMSVVGIDENAYKQADSTISYFIGDVGYEVVSTCR